MLQDVFMNIITMSLTAIPIILVVLLARMVLKFAPKVFSYALWAVVLFRLLCPFSFEMNFSLVPDKVASGEVVESYAESYVGDVKVYEAGTAEYDVAVEQGMKPESGSESYIVVTADGKKQAKTFGESWGSVLSIVWVVGIAALVSYSMVSLAQLKKRLMGSMLYKGNVYLADYIDSPFVLGVVRPKIYLPSKMPENEYIYTILHEIYHIKRWDHVIKLLAFIALCIHWFNPFVWLAFVLAMTDMEMSCDEAVLKQIGESVKADYSISLLGFATGKRYVTASFLAFGEVNPKARIKNVLKWKKPVVIFSVIAAVLVVFVGVICLSNPLEKNYLEKTSSIVSNNNRNNGVAEDEDFIYFVYAMDVKKISKKDNSVETIYTFEGEVNMVNTFECFDGRLFFITYDDDFISMDTNGENIIKTKLEIKKPTDTMYGGNPVPKPWVSGGNLYLLTHSPYRAYLVNPHTLEVEEVDYEIAEQYQTEDGKIFTNRLEDEVRKLYVKLPSGEERLFSAEDESVIDSHYTKAYVFYQAFKMVDSEFQTDSLYLYRVDLDGKNKVLVKEIIVAESSGNVRYDNEYAYIYMNEPGCLRIHKETLKETIVKSIQTSGSWGNEISNGKYFSAARHYFIDCETGEMTNFTMTEYEAYNMLEERYAFRPVEFGYIPVLVEFKSVEVNAEQRFAKIHYEGADSSWIDLYVAERYMSTNPQFYMNVEDVMYQVYSGDEKESYQAESRERGPIEVKVFQSRISDAPVIEAYFAGHKGEEYVIQSYNIPQEDFNLIIENLRFEK